MSAFLTKILKTKQEEVKQLHKHRNVLERGLGQLPPARGFAKAISTALGIAVVAEIKQASPSKGLITKNFQPEVTAQAYEKNGACAISVLTDVNYFLGSMDILRRVRAVTQAPILRKDFIIDELQVMEARQAGADAILLICAALSPDRLSELSTFAKSLSMDVLIEVHTEAELASALHANPSVLGVNNRNLHSFEVSLATTEELLRRTPKGTLAISESGIYTPEDAARMYNAGARGILVGESLMRAESPSQLTSLLQSFQTAHSVAGVINSASARL
jgi:indole-3-glycerol phosphate synthase